MRLNGNLVLNAGGLSEIQNAVVERVSQLPSFSAAEKGRFVFLTTEGKVYFNDGSQWSTMATGGNASALQAEVDTLESALGALFTQAGGFNAVGAVLANVTGATTLTEVISQLDAALTAAKNATAAEASRATAAEASLSAALAAETTRAEGAEADLQAAIDAEAAARLAAGKTFASDLAAEVTARSTADSTLTTNLAAETTRATTAEAGLQSAIDAEAASRQSADSSETASRIAADIAAAAAASDQLATETTARLAGDAAATTRMNGIQAELDATQVGAGLGVDGVYTAPANTNYLGSATSLSNADVKLDTAIKAEADRASGAEANLSSAIANEAQLRSAGDANLQAQLTAYINGKVDQNATQDAAEAAARIAADAALQAELDQTQASIGLDDDGKIIPVTNTNYLNGITSVFGGAFVLDTQIKSVADAVAAETLAREEADSVFQANLDAEKAAREAKDNSLQAELNITQAGAGLETTGAYAAPSDSNYLNAAVSLKDADYILDAAIKVQEDAIATLTATSGSALASEIAARVAGDNAAKAAVTSEVNRAQAAESVLAADISAEAAARQAADTTLTSGLAAEVADRTSGDAALQAEVDQINANLGKIYYLYDGAAATSHTVSHGLGQKYASVTVIDANTDEVIIPQAIVFGDANTLTVTLNAALAIKVVVVAVGFVTVNVIPAA